MRTLGEQIKDLRIKNGMTQEELAQRLNTTKAAISRYESNHRQPKLEVLTSIAMILNANPDELFGLYFQSENVGDENGNKGEHYFNALSRWIQTVMPDAIKEASSETIDDWLTEINSPFALYHAEDLTIVKKLIETIVSLDSSWKEELLSDAQKYLEFQERKKAKLEKMQMDVK